MGGLEASTSGGSVRIPATQPREGSASSIRLILRKAKEKIWDKFSGERKLPEESGSGADEKTPPPVLGTREEYRTNCLRGIKALSGKMNSANLFWEHDLESLLRKARAGFDPEADGQDAINQEVCACVLGAAIFAQQKGVLGVLVDWEARRILEWGSRNLFIMEMQGVCERMVKKMDSLPKAM